jgi:hypothetical protein
LRLDLQAPTPAHPSITAALDAYLKEHNGWWPWVEEAREAL